jgi:hypothetical protein
MVICITLPTAIWNILGPLGNVVNFPRFGILSQEKSGNPEKDRQ